MGSSLPADPTRIIAKRIILTGHPFKLHKKTATIRYMFFNREDVEYFQSVELHTKYGRIGHIQEPLGTHGYFKAHFDGMIGAMDTICMSLYKRQYPKVCFLWFTYFLWEERSLIRCSGRKTFGRRLGLLFRKGMGWKWRREMHLVCKMMLDVARDICRLRHLCLCEAILRSLNDLGSHGGRKRFRPLYCCDRNQLYGMEELSETRNQDSQCDSQACMSASHTDNDSIGLQML